MNKEQQRIAIAEACGFGPYDCYDLIDGHLYGSDYGRIGRTKLPDYLNDLNAMHRVENTLSVEQKYKYVCILREMTAGITMPEYGCTFTTAEQRAEAFLRTLGLWRETNEE